EETYPQEKINEINKQLSSLEEQQEAEQLAKEKAAKLETEYLAAISLADQELSSENHEQAKKKYAEALNLKPNESYPQQKIEEIDAYFEQQANKDAEKAAALAAEM